jgi:death-on-curing protein
MILLNDILYLHEQSIIQYGGAEGIRDIEMLQSAIERPFQTFGGIDLYPSPTEKAAALGESLIINHPFIDGNKRTGALAMATLLKEYSINITADNNQFYNFIIDISTGEKKFETIVAWLKENTTPII